MISKNSVAIAGEFAVLSQLSLRGFDANMTLGHTKGVDILVSDPEKNKMFKVASKLIGATSFISKGTRRDFCEKNINMAELVKDGQKIYIPYVQDTNTQQGYPEASMTSKKISINSASIAELDTLWGIGSTRAESIVKNRPYGSIDELITKGVLTKSLVDRNRDLLSVY